MASVNLCYDEAPAVSFESIAILPEPGDNCAIVRLIVEAGSRIILPSGVSISLSHRLLEGHRFSAENIEKGAPLLSWGLPFGIALRNIVQGEYVVNSSMLDTLGARGILGLPSSPNFIDYLMPFEVSRESILPSPEVPVSTDAGLFAFEGFSRAGKRGVGTRNYVVIIGTTTASSGFVRALEVAAKSAGLAAKWHNVDGVVAVAHTEGAGNRATGDLPHNHALLVETLASYVLHPNVGAALLCDFGSDEETVWAQDVIAALGADGPYATVSSLLLTGDHAADISAGIAHINECEMRTIM